MNRVLVTGASGFLGRHVCNALVVEGAQPIPAVRPGSNAVVPHWESRVELDLCRPETIDAALDAAKPDAIVHCAAYGVDYRQQDPIQAVAVNLAGTVALFQAAEARGIAPFVHVGTGYEYGSQPGAISEDAPLRPVGLYGATKAAASLVLSDLGRRSPTPPIIVRVFSMYGPGEGDHKLVPQILNAARTGRPLDLGPGDEVRDYSFVRDVALGIAWLARSQPPRQGDGPVLNLCTGEATTVRAFATAVASRLGVAELLRFDRLPARPDRLASVVGDPCRWRALSERAGRPELAQPTTLADGVALTAPDLVCVS